MPGRLAFLQSIPRDAKILIFSNAFRSFSSALLAVAFPIYLSKIGVSPVLIGLTFMGIILFSAIRSLVEGIIADRLGRKPVLLFIAASLVVGGAIFIVTTNITILLIAAILFTVGGSITYTPAEIALLGDKVSDGNRTMAYSINATLATAASILGSFAGALPDALQKLGLPEILAYQQIFVVFAAVGAVCLILFVLLKEVKSEPHPEDSAPPTEQDLSERKFLLRWSSVVAFDEIGGSFNNLLSYWYYLRFGVGPAEIGLITGLGRFIATLSFALGLRMAKRFGTIRATVMSRVPIFIINFLTPFMPSFAIVAASRLLMSVFSDIDVPLRHSYIMGVTKSRSRASTYGVVQVVSRFTSAGAPAITGYLYEFVSLSFPFYGAGFFQFASAASMYLFFKDVKPPEERQASGSDLAANVSLIMGRLIYPLPRIGCHVDRSQTAEERQAPIVRTDIAIETAGISLANNNLEGIPRLLRLGRGTMRIVKLNIAFALTVNAIGIVLSAAGVVTPLTASIIHESNALLVMLNSLRLLRVD